MSESANTKSSSSVAGRAASLAAIALVAATLGALLSARDIARAERRAAIVGPHGELLHVEIADTTALRVRGLSGRPILDTDGMLLVFDVSADHSIWMRGMQFPLDLLWLDDAARIVAMRERVDACPTNSCPIFVAQNDHVRYVLELPAGYMSDRQWAVGDDLLLQMPGIAPVGSLQNLSKMLEP
jgi:uncharacterized membrane protein (UPF0127 family)